MSVSLKKVVNDFAVGIYESSFPADERRDTEQWKSMPDADSRFSINVVLQRAEEIGIVTLWSLSDFIYIEHFAIEKSSRGLGIGKKVLEYLKRQCNCIVLEAEMPEVSDIARKRIEFYRHMGFRVFSDKYIQPPYGKGKAPVNMKLLIWGQDMDFDKVRHIVHAEVYGKKD